MKRRLNHWGQDRSSESLLIFSRLNSKFFVGSCGCDVSLKFGSNNCLMSLSSLVQFNDFIIKLFLLYFVCSFYLRRWKLNVIWITLVISRFNFSFLFSYVLLLSYHLINLIFVLIIIIILSWGKICKLFSLLLNDFLITFLFSFLCSLGTSFTLTLLCLVLRGMHRSDS